MVPIQLNDASPKWDRGEAAFVDGGLDRQGEQTALSTRTLLLVEDEQFAREAGQELLQAEGYQVLTADDGHSALAFCDDSRVDLLITDVGLPEMNGAELVEKWRELHPDTPVIFVSAQSPNDTRLRQALAHERTVFLQKPVAFEDLTRIIQSLLVG